MDKISILKLMIVLTLAQMIGCTSINIISLDAGSSGKYDIFIDDELVKDGVNLSPTDTVQIELHSKNSPLRLQVISEDEKSGFSAYAEIRHNILNVKLDSTINLIGYDYLPLKITLDFENYIFRQYDVLLSFDLKEPQYNQLSPKRANTGWLFIRSSLDNITIWDGFNLIGTASRNQPLIVEVPEGKSKIFFRHKYYKHHEIDLEIKRDEIYKFTVEQENKVEAVLLGTNKLTLSLGSGEVYLYTKNKNTTVVISPYSDSQLVAPTSIKDIPAGLYNLKVYNNGSLKYSEQIDIEPYASIKFDLDARSFLNK